MKLAIQISGQARDFVSMYPNFKETFKNFDYDVFISTWRNTDNTRFADEGTPEEFVNLYNARAYEIEDYKSVFEEKIKPLADKCFDNKAPEINPYWYLSGLYQVSYVNTIRQNSGQKYDYVVKLRTELRFEHPLQREHLTPDKLFIPAGHNSRGINDVVSWGEPWLMDAYCDLYKNIEMYVNWGCLFHPEYLLKFHLEQYGVQIERPEFPFTLRGDRITDLP